MIKINLNTIKLLSESKEKGFEEYALGLANSIDGHFATYDSDTYEKLFGSNESAPPTLGEKIKSLSSSLNTWVKKGAPTVSDEIFNGRLSICKTCPEWDSEFFVGTGRCKKCGCATLAKLRMATSSCPLDPPLWGSV